MPGQQVRQQLIEVFKRWGKPGAMRVDNGLPFGAPNGQATPVLALWLIAIDVDMIWNKPHCPQQNGRVERMQHTTAKWAEIARTCLAKELQARLNTALRVQREEYPVTRLQNQTRLMAFPGVQIMSRPYATEDFNIQRAYDFLGHKLYTRKVSVSGQITHFGELYGVGVSLRHQWVQLRLTSDGSNWEVLSDYKVVKLLPAFNLTAECIQNLISFKEHST